MTRYEVWKRLIEDGTCHGEPYLSCRKDKCPYKISRDGRETKGCLMDRMTVKQDYLKELIEVIFDD